jgi:hypothetical protein
MAAKLKLLLRTRPDESMTPTNSNIKLDTDTILPSPSGVPEAPIL